MKKALVCGAGGFIGHHLVTRLKKDGYWVIGLDRDASYAIQDIQLDRPLIIVFGNGVLILSAVH